MNEPSLSWSGPRRNLRLLYQGILFEFRKTTEFRTGFVIREILNGLARPLVMILVYWVIFQSKSVGESLNGFDFKGITHYLLLAAMMQKLVFHNRALDLSTQIFEGYITKYFVMPFRYFYLALARFCQYISVQIGVAFLFYLVGFTFFHEYWPIPVSWTAALQAVILTLLGSYCFFLTYFIINTLAFWLDVVWTLIVGAWFVGNFVSGLLIPVSIMPEILQKVFYWTFPYWTVSAPAELFIGRLETHDFWEGLGVLCGTICLLDLLRRIVWKRGIRRYTGAGM